MKPGSGLVMVLVATGLLSRATEGRACGGCFSPPGAVQIVTDHRMVLSLSSVQTTLWDQFGYRGDPAEFSWVLPIHNGPEVQVAVADNTFLALLDNLTAPVVALDRNP